MLKVNPNSRNYMIGSGFLLAALIVILLMIRNCNSDREIKPSLADYFKNPNHQTIVYVDSSKYNLPKVPDLAINIPPKVIIRYIDTSKASNNELYVDTSKFVYVIDSLGQLLAKYHSDFLESYVSSSKLLGGYFTKDTLALDLMKSSGDISGKIYLVDYNKYRYYIREDSFYVEELKNSTTQKKRKIPITHGAYVNTGYSAFPQGPLASLDYQVNVGRVRLTAEVGTIISNNPSAIVLGKVGFRLNKNNGYPKNK